MAESRQKKFFILGIFSALYFVGLSVFTGIMGFSIFWLILTIRLIVFGLIKEFGIKYKININKKLKNVLLVFLALEISSFIVIESFIIYFGCGKRMRDSDYLLILGAGLYRERMPLTLSQRMEKELEYLKMYSDIKIIV